MAEAKRAADLAAAAEAEHQRVEDAAQVCVWGVRLVGLVIGAMVWMPA